MSNIIVFTQATLDTAETNDDSSGWNWETCRMCRELFETQGETICFECKTLPEANSPVWQMGHKERVGLIRKALKQLIPTLSVRQGRGTAGSWIDIGGSAPYGHTTPEEQAAVEALGIRGSIAPGEHEYWIFKLYPELGNLGDMAKARQRARMERESWD
jgi:hypothetical protein